MSRCLTCLERDEFESFSMCDRCLKKLQTEITRLKKSLDESYTDGEKLQDDYQDVKEENIDLKSCITALEKVANDAKEAISKLPEDCMGEIHDWFIRDELIERLSYAISNTAELGDKGSAARKPNECQGCDRGFITVILPNGAKQIAEYVPCKESSPATPSLKSESSNGRTPDFDSGDGGSTPSSDATPQPECPECTEGDHDATIK